MSGPSAKTRIYFENEWQRWVVDCTHPEHLCRKSFKREADALELYNELRRRPVDSSMDRATGKLSKSEPALSKRKRVSPPRKAGSA